VAREPAFQCLEGAFEGPADAPFELTLFVSGASSSSSHAIRHVKALCDAHLAGRHRLTIVDVNQDTDLARGRRVLATPTLVKDLPVPRRMLVGDFSDHGRVLRALGLDVPDPG
jgi:circadian clock protein KaiB